LRYLALACDYDGTIAHDGRISDETLESLRRVRESKRRLILVTGRELPDLRRVCPDLDLFDIVVAENGALIFEPSAQEAAALADPPPPRFAEELRRRGVEPFSTGEVIVATWSPHESAVLEVIREQGLELHVIFNKGAVMVLPSGVNKAFGLRAALERLKLSPHNVVGVGDAENDHAFLTLCECSAAVANALPSVKENVTFVTGRERGEGVEELIQELIESDLRGREEGLRRPKIPLGRSVHGSDIALRPLADHLLIAGQSGSGKSTLVTSILESLAECRYQFCLIDPEGDYEGVEDAVFIGDPEHAPNVDEVLALLEQPDDNVVVNLLNVGIEARPAYLEELLEKLRSFHARTGRPHRLILDEAHHMLPPNATIGGESLAERCQAAVLVTVHPEHLAQSVMSAMDRIVIVGKDRQKSLAGFAEALGVTAPPPPADPEQGDA
jgi:hydroxymethylpyrimidine pyrophosphatase-like HAD family hydrolase